MNSLVAFIMILCIACVIGRGELVGGYRSAAVDDPGVQKYAKFASQKINAQSNSLHHMKLVNITKAQKQVVAGLNYKLEMALGVTECKKNTNSDMNIEECPLLKCRASQICTAKVWVKEWENFVEMTEFKCVKDQNPCSEYDTPTVVAM